MSEIQMYKDREAFAKLLNEAKNISFTEDARGTYDWADVKKFIDNYRDRLHKEDKYRDDPLTEEEMVRIKVLLEELFNKAALYVYNRECRFEKLKEMPGDRVGDLLEKAIYSLTEQIEPDVYFYLRPTYSEDGLDEGLAKVRRAHGDINRDIVFLREYIKKSESIINSIKLGHYQINGDVIDKDVLEKKYKQKIFTALEKIKILESLKVEVAKKFTARKKERRFLINKKDFNKVTKDVVSMSKIEEYYVMRDKEKRRYRKDGVMYYYTIKGTVQSNENNIVVIEEEKMIDEEEYCGHLDSKIGFVMEKNRYKVPIQVAEREYIAQIDRYRGKLNGLLIIQVEFDNCEEAEEFTPPSWFKNEITDDPKYWSANLAVEGLNKSQKKFI